MGKLFIRLSVVFIAVYLLFAFIASYFIEKNFWSQSYYVLVELCACIYMTVKWKYHCEYLRWTMYGITLAEIMININNCILCVCNSSSKIGRRRESEGRTV